jgi:hypothetical protein
MIQKIKSLFHRYFLMKELKFHSTDRNIINLQSAKEIGIIFYIKTPDDTNIINQFAIYLKEQKKKVNILAFYNSKKTAINFNFPYFNRKDINWHFEPVSQNVTDFIQKKFDILINLVVGDCPPLEYVSAFSNASFRVGMYENKKLHCADLMIDLQGKSDLSYLIEQVKTYLLMIK